MLRKFTKEGRFECGLEDVVKGKVWCFVAVLPGQKSAPNAALGVAIANERGYTPIPFHWAHSDTWDEMKAHAAELNDAEGFDARMCARIVSSTMAAQNKAEREAAPIAMIGKHKVRVSREGVAAFNRSWPGSKLRDTRAYWFEFDEEGNLVDTDCPESDDGPEAAVMSDDCKAFAFEDERPEWAHE